MIGILYPKLPYPLMILNINVYLYTPTATYTPSPSTVPPVCLESSSNKALPEDCARRVSSFPLKKAARSI